ncbi:DUF763 domain-containing protein [Thermosulfurimonas marina]|uniref:DUF763 domain-containing protein n=1 Tax=Thermosulfurimonas marina TaxID=2047767 RepID=A0A6H1WQR9_9BACT|nr:DUF763 domain-containing protein [Thermosulfurimonas marina]QJA05542.1 DUF763 domain-containing protein [Thermosulfurimonas marina]
MRRTGVADLPLHGGRAPRWLFERMVRLARALSLVILEEFGRREFLRRLSDPFWFQALGCLLGFDWHSSGLTTTVCGALKEALRPLSLEVGVFVCGGKARASLRTPEEILSAAERAGLPEDFRDFVDLSRLTAKVDNTALQDGYQLYHHVFIFTVEGDWTVIQQGLNEASGFARRYHWFSGGLSDLVEAPHSGIVAARKEAEVLDLTARKSRAVREGLCALLREPPEKLLREMERLPRLGLPSRHSLTERDLHPRGLEKVLLKAYEKPPRDFRELLLLKGMGPRSLRALTLTAELLYNVRASREDPARYAFAHGGKDGHPFPVDRRTYEDTVAFLEETLRRARLGERERLSALKRLASLK